MKIKFLSPRIFIIWAIISVFLFSAEYVKACSCMVSPPVDIAFEKTPVVVVVKLQAVVESEISEESVGDVRPLVSKLTVERVFKGKLKIGQELKIGLGDGGNCNWFFVERSIGQKYLLYLDEKAYTKSLLSVSICSRSGSVEHRDSDLRYLENLEKVRGKTRLSGRLMQDARSATEENSFYEPLAGRTVQIVGMGKDIKLKTDENGFYEIYDLPPGKYKITTEKIQGYKTDELKIVEIKAKSHAEADLYFEINNGISGKVFDTNGKPLEDVCIDLIPLSGEKVPYFYSADCTDKEGKFEIGQIPAGSYLIVINDDGEISAKEPFGTFYYPSAVKKEDAAQITIGAGDFINDLVITAPTMAETITISGIVLFERSGKNIKADYERVSVEFISEKLLEESSDVTLYGNSREFVDENGRFTITILKGQKGKLFADMNTFEGEYENCPKLEKIIRENKNELYEVTTNTVEIEAVSNMAGIELKFPFPSCKKAKIE